MYDMKIRSRGFLDTYNMYYIFLLNINIYNIYKKIIQFNIYIYIYNWVKKIEWILLIIYKILEVVLYVFN